MTAEQLVTPEHVRPAHLRAVPATVSSCTRCRRAEHRLVRGATRTSRICRSCYEGMRLHHEHRLLTHFGIGAIVVGAAILVVILALVLATPPR